MDDFDCAIGSQNENVSQTFINQHSMTEVAMIHANFNLWTHTPLLLDRQNQEEISTTRERQHERTRISKKTNENYAHMFGWR